MNKGFSIQNKITVSATNLKKLRKNLKLSQAQLALKAGISLRTYQYIETGKQMPTIKTALLICEALGEHDITKIFQLRMDKDVRTFLKLTNNF